MEAATGLKVSATQDSVLAGTECPPLRGHCLVSRGFPKSWALSFPNKRGRVDGHNHTHDEVHNETHSYARTVSVSINPRSVQQLRDIFACPAPKRKNCHQWCSVRKQRKYVAECLALWREHKEAGTLPTSVRFLFYELVACGTIPKKNDGARQPAQDVSGALMRLREEGAIPWDDITDETRYIDYQSGAASIADWMIQVSGQARLDPWNGAAPVVITESRSLAGVLRPLAQQYLVTTISTCGQCGGFLHTVVARNVTPEQQVLYLGDLDMSGGHIEENVRTVLEKELNCPLAWERLAITRQQAADFKLTAIQKYDGRTKRHHDAIETEALGQATIVDLLRTRLNELLPEPIEKVLKREERQRHSLQRLMSGWKKTA
ncbi:MAG: hypothetical protein ACRD4C_06780 [Candidatus Acidiferrales bacterium]